MPEWEAPAKVNLDLRVGARDETGLHALRSVVQTVDLFDLLAVEEGDEDVLEVEGAELPEGGDNLVWRAVAALGLERRPPLHVRLDKQIPVGAGLGGGSSDAAAMLAATADMLRLPASAVEEAAGAVGSDVPLFRVGGTMVVEGHGQRVSRLDSLDGFAVAIAVPDFELATVDVYRRWDELDGPEGDEVAGRSLPPPLRTHGELRNDLVPAAVALRPELGDFMAQLASVWERPVMMSGSGPACFAFFLDPDEAQAAAAEAPLGRAALAAGLRRHGVRRREGSDGS